MSPCCTQCTRSAFGMQKEENTRGLLSRRLLKKSQDDAGGALTAQHYTDLSTAMAVYLAHPSSEACLDCGGDMRLIRQALEGYLCGATINMNVWCSCWSIQINQNMTCRRPNIE